MLAFHIIPDIESAYMMKIGILENEVFNANMKLLRINRKIELYKERKKYNDKPDEEIIEKQLDIEFSDIEEEYNEMQEDMYCDMGEDDEFSEEMTTEFLKLVNIIYKNLIKKLSPLINFNNTRLDNQLYELLEKSYRELDLTMMSKLQIGDMKTLKKAKKTFENLIDENEEIILNIKCSDSYNKKRVLEDENLLRRTKNEINKELAIINEEYKKAQKELNKILEN